MNPFKSKYNKEGGFFFYSYSVISRAANLGFQLHIVGKTARPSWRKNLVRPVVSLGFAAANTTSRNPSSSHSVLAASIFDFPPI